MRQKVHHNWEKDG